MYIYDNKTELFQWELNQKVVVEDNKVKEVHFTNDMLSKALVVEVYEFEGKRVANIPNEILQHNFDIMAYGFCGESVRETLSINVIGRSKPEDYVYTETEIKRYETLEGRISGAELHLGELDSIVLYQGSKIGELEEEIKNIEVTPMASDMYSNALKGNATGSAVALDVSPIEHILGVKARNKNLLKPTIMTKWLCNGSVADDGFITLTATATSGSAYAVVGRVTLKKGVTYGCNFINATNMGAFRFWLPNTTTSKWDGAGAKIYTPTEDITLDIAIYMKDITLGTASGYVQLEESATAPTSYTPYVEDVTAANVQRYGKNLFNPTYTLTNHTIKMQNSIVAEHNQAYTVSFDKTCTEIDIVAEFADGTTQTKYLAFNNTFARFKIVGNIVNYGNNFAAAQTFDKPIVKFSVSAYGAIADGWDTEPLAQLEINTQQTEYEPYTEPTTYDISTDGIVEGVTSLYPTTTLMSDTLGVVIDVNYNKDINKAFEELIQAIISMGGNI